MTRGRLRPPLDAPAVGECSEVVVQLGGVVVEHILSGILDASAAYDQDHDEWAVVLNGAAILEVEGETIDLVAGDWVLLPAHVPHRLVETQPGTTWLALRTAPGAYEAAGGVSVAGD